MGLNWLIRLTFLLGLLSTTTYLGFGSSAKIKIEKNNDLKQKFIGFGNRLAPAGEQRLEAEIHWWKKRIEILKESVENLQQSINDLKQANNYLEQSINELKQANNDLL